MQNRIREIRKKLGLTMKELGVIVGLAESTISHYETGKRQPDYETLLKLSEYFGVSVDYLIGADSKDAPADSGKSIFIDNIISLPKMNQIPLLGTIACGAPILAQENIDEQIDLPEHIHADFALRCKGDSMINARIFDGDIVYIRQQPTVQDGQIAAVLIDGEATLKRVRLFADHLVLEPENPQYRPISFWGADMNTPQILGLAVAFTSTVK